MSLAPRLDLRQSQSLVMTPQLQQAIKLLTLSNLEIEAFIGEELERNPLLELGGEDVGGEVAASGVDAAFDAPAAPAPSHAPWRTGGWQPAGWSEKSSAGGSTAAPR